VGCFFFFPPYLFLFFPLFPIGVWLITMPAQLGRGAGCVRQDRITVLRSDCTSGFLTRPFFPRIFPPFWSVTPQAYQIEMIYLDAPTSPASIFLRPATGRVTFFFLTLSFLLLFQVSSLNPHVEEYCSLSLDFKPVLVLAFLLLREA